MSPASRHLALALLLVSLLALPTSVAAQYRVEAPESDASDEDVARARELFVEGQGHLDAGRWADALARFEQCYRLSGVPAALFNVGTALRSMGRHRDARDAFTELLALDGLDPDTRAEAEARRNEEAGRVALILLAGLERSPDAEVLLDGLMVTVTERNPAELETDPGRHAVRVEQEGFRSWRRELTLGDGERARLEVVLDAIDTPAPIIVAPDTEEFWESPVFWIVVGALLVGGGVVAGVVAWDQAQLRPRAGFDQMVVHL